MGEGSGLYMYDVVVKRLRSLSHLLMSSCFTAHPCVQHTDRPTHRLRYICRHRPHLCYACDAA